MTNEELMVCKLRGRVYFWVKYDDYEDEPPRKYCYEYQTNRLRLLKPSGWKESTITDFEKRIFLETGSCENNGAKPKIVRYASEEESHD